jgi:hypothetical protein
MNQSLDDSETYLDQRREVSSETFMEARRGSALPEPGHERPGEPLAVPSSTIEPPSIPDGTFVKVHPDQHPLPRACEVTVYFQDYHRSSSKLGRFGKIVGIDEAGGEYLVMLDNFECLAAPMRRVEWRKVAT